MVQKVQTRISSVSNVRGRPMKMRCAQEQWCVCRLSKRTQGSNPRATGMDFDTSHDAEGAIERMLA